MTLEKLTSKNWFPITERVPVYAEHLNVVIDEINNMTNGGSESTSGEVYPLIPIAAQNEIAINGAIILTNFLTTIDSTGGALALTLANGVVVGQLKKIIFRVDNGDAVVTGNFTGTNTILTFSDAGEYALLQWNGTEWIALELGSVLNMTHAPVISGLV